MRARARDTTATDTVTDTDRDRDRETNTGRDRQTNPQASNRLNSTQLSFNLMIITNTVLYSL